MRTYDELKTLQEAWEAEAIGEAQERAREKLADAMAEGEASSTRGGTNLIKGSIQIVAAGIQAYLGAHEGKGRKPLAVSILRTLDAHKAAWVATYAMLNRTLYTRNGQPDVRAVASAIGHAIETEVWFQGLPQDMANRIYEKVVSDHSDVAIREKAARGLAQRKGMNYVAWGNDNRVSVGKELVNIIAGSTQLFEITPNNEVQLTADAAEYLKTTNDEHAAMSFRSIPMLIKPRAWKNTWTGAYRTAHLRSAIKLVRTHDREHLKLIDQHISSGTAKQWLQSINQIQETPFKINTAVLEVMEKVFAAGGGLGKLTQTKHVDRVQFPENYAELTDEERKGWRLLAREAAVENRGIDNDTILTRGDLRIARRLAEFDEFYVPVSCDFRGRVYPVPSFNYQRADHVKSLFLFAKGVPLGTYGMKWLMIHCANVGDFGKVSKLSFDARVEWTFMNKEMIRATANDPMGTVSWWGKADKPWQFLAACFELAAAWSCDHLENYVSRIAIPLDGSNSGLQHYSAQMRSEREAALVNIIPSEKPADIYATVAAIVKQLVEAEDSTIPTLWKAYGVDRKVVKRAVMTYPYSSGQFGFREQFEEDLMKPLGRKVLKRELEKHPFGDRQTQWESCGLMAKHTYTAITQTVSDATLGMKFYQDIAGVLAHEKKPVSWITPLGFPVVHSYKEWDVKVLDWWLTDMSLPVTPESTLDHAGNPMRRICANIRIKPTEVIKKSKQRSAISPNVIHSADATHLLLSVIRGVEAGIYDYQLIHDSFATHAGNTQQYFSVIREAFVELYEAWDPFQAIYDSAWLQLSDKGRGKLPTVPPKGNLDLRLVLQSPYAFA